MMIRIILSITLILILASCASSSGHTIIAANPKDTKRLDERYSIRDLHIHVKAMVQSMLRSPKVFKDKPEPPKIALGDIHIGVGIEQRIDVNAIKKSIRTNLMKSGKAKFIDLENRKILESFIDYQNESKYIDPTTAQEKGKFLAAEYVLTGDISAMKNQSSTVSKTVYTLNMKLTNIKTSELAWSEEKEIHSKVVK